MHRGCLHCGDFKAYKHTPTLVLYASSPEGTPRHHVCEQHCEDLTKSAPNPCAPAHGSLWRISRIINKQKYAASHEVEVIHYIRTCRPARTYTQWVQYLHACNIFSAGAPVVLASLVLLAGYTHMCI